ncbi:hypothetical protein TNCV_2945451 [Trichonephila clavipes]|nr:hypothetical protein TNCV_2945451 [Trichonephila clavipes]
MSKSCKLRRQILSGIPDDPTINPIKSRERAGQGKIEYLLYRDRPELKDSTGNMWSCAILKKDRGFEYRTQPPLLRAETSNADCADDEKKKCSCRVPNDWPYHHFRCKTPALISNTSRSRAFSSKQACFHHDAARKIRTRLNRQCSATPVCLQFCR